MGIDSDPLISRVVDRALSPKEGDPALEQFQTQKRMLGEKLRKELMAYLVESKENVEQVIKKLHKLSTVGVKAYEDEGNSEELAGGEYRKANVSIGDYVPPKSDDVEELMKLFSERLSVLQYQATSTSIDHVAAWAYVVLIAIHPFPDGNGRAARGLVDFVKSSFQYEREGNLANDDYQQRSVLELSKEEKEKVSVQVDDMLKQLELAPKIENSTTSLEAYLHAKAAGQPEVYFAAVKAAIEKQLNMSFIPTDLQSDERFKGMVEIVRQPVDKARTKPLIEDYAKKVVADVTSKIN